MVGGLLTVLTLSGAVLCAYAARRPVRLVVLAVPAVLAVLSATVASAIPALFERLDGLTTDLDNPPEIRGWVFRGHTRLHATWSR